MMARAFAAINFTDSVKAAQTRYRSREANLGFELAEDSRQEITAREAEFIEARDSFYQATVNEDGWPYVQHRGGPRGFLKVLDENTIGFADFSGNKQYLSVGNLNANDRIAIILMDYRERRRLKIWGRVRIVHEADEPALIAQLEMTNYRARVERALVITVEAWDWNCPQHITPRYTNDDIEELIQPLQNKISMLTKTLSSSSISTNAATATITPKELGDGKLPLVISGIRQLTPDIRAIELRDPSGQPLPEVRAGSHLAVPVILNNGMKALRYYSIASNPNRRDIYELAVHQEMQGEGGSAFVHKHFQLGMVLHCGLPANHFQLQDDQAPVVLIAGGIGITAIKPMAQSLQSQGRAFHLHYTAKSPTQMAYRDRLVRDLGGQITSYFSQQEQRLDLEALFRDAATHTQFYVCGPERLIKACLAAAAQFGVDRSQIYFERFSVAANSQDVAFDVVLRRSQRVIKIAANQTVLQGLTAAGVDTLSDCGVGICGTCAIKVLAGDVDHRDTAFTDAERAGSKLMCVCVSRAKSTLLELDL
ncbi:MAG: pyridoxamine 5'-phosphate oxidase family protein [Undibacterium sp.]|nr:pyridoxamine 5'-phosphate oxidase family protein [Undibacterium sp.]